MKDYTFELLMKSWEMYQNLAKGFGDSCWKVRSLGVGFWATIIGFSYNENDVVPLYFSLLVLTLFFFLETGLKRLQYKYIYLSIDVEKSLNDILVGDTSNLPNNGISTNIDTPDINDFLELFRLKRWMFWLPYFVLTIITLIIIWQFDVINIC